ncbi:MAG TPA: tetratricopeptide repeat protein [Chryseosolibacter sp.]|nr:tetratricopeptide repeat protein [Chryseosolibacter sp.]
MKSARFSSFFVALFITVCATGQTTDVLETALDTVQGDKKVKTLNELFRSNLQGDPVKALGYAREALSLATEINDDKGMAAAYNNLGVSYRSQGALDKALEYYINSLKIYERLDNKEGIATTKNNIANIYSIKKDYALAMRNLEESYTLFKQLKDEDKIIGSMNNLGNLYSDIQLFEKAHKYFSEAYQLSEQQGMPFSDPLNNLGNIYFKQNDFDKAVEYYQRAYEIEEKSGNKLGTLNTVINLGIANTKAKQTKQADFYLKRALSLCEELQAFSSMPTILKATAENYYNQGKMKEAYETQLRYDEEREKIHGDESSRNIAQMEMVIEFEEKEREYEVLKREAAIKALELKNSRLFIILVILAVIVLIAGFNMFYLDRRRKLVSSGS